MFMFSHGFTLLLLFIYSSIEFDIISHHEIFLLNGLILIVCFIIFFKIELII